MKNVNESNCFNGFINRLVVELYAEGRHYAQAIATQSAGVGTQKQQFSEVRNAVQHLSDEHLSDEGLFELRVKAGQLSLVLVQAERRLDRLINEQASFKKQRNLEDLVLFLRRSIRDIRPIAF